MDFSIWVVSVRPIPPPIQPFGVEVSDFLPVLSDSDVDRQRHVEGRGRLHLLADQLGDRLGPPGRDLEQQLIMHGQDHSRVR